MASIKENLITLTSNINRIKNEVSDVTSAFDNAGLKTSNNKLLLSDIVNNINNNKITILVDKSVSKFVYTVTGFSSTYSDANGNYYKYLSQINGRDCYTNGKCYMYYQPNYWMGWTINSNLDNTSNPSYYAYISGESIIGNWTSNNSDQIIVLEYTGELVENQTDKIPTVTISVSGEGVSSTSSIGTLNVTTGYNPSFGYTSNLTVNCFPESTYNLIPGNYNFSLNNPTGFNTSLLSGSSYGTINGGAELNLQILCSPRTDCSLTISCMGSPSSPDGYPTSLSTAKWSIDNGVTWTDSGYSRYDLTYNQLYTVIFSEVQGYTTPSPIQIRLSDYGMTSDYRSVTYQSTMGVLLVSGSNYPTGAQWSIDGGTTWKEFNTSVTINAGSYTIQFKDVSGYTTPAPQTATVTAGQRTSITVGEYVASGGGDSDKTYVYTVSGAGTTEINGNYWQSSDTFNGYPVYTNGIYYICNCNGNNMWDSWSIHTSIPSSINDTMASYVYYQEGTGASEPLGTFQPKGGLSGVVTITAYAGSGSGEETSNSITVSGFGVATLQKFNTTYQLSSDGKYWQADGSSAGVLELRIYHGDHPGTSQPCWIFGDDTGTMEAFIYSTNSDPMSIVGSQSCDDAYGTNYTLTITAGGDSGDSGDNDKTYVYTVSGADIADANGNYYQDGTLNGYPAYTNDSYWLIRVTNAYNNWGFYPNKPSEGQYMGYSYYKQPGSDASTPIDNATNYYTNITEVKTSIVVAEYSGSSSGGGESGGGSGSAKITITGADQTGANQTYSLTSGDPDNLSSGAPVIFTGDSNTSSMAWTIKFQYIPEADMTEVNIYCDLMIGMGPELQYMTMSAAEPTIDNILNNSPVWTDSTGSSRKDLSVTYSSGGSLPGGLHEFVYKVAGAGFTEANGNYWDSGEMYDGTYPIYTNGKYKMYQYDMLGYCIDNENGFTIYTSMDGFTGNWTTNGNGGEPAPTVTEYSGASSSIVVSNAMSDINWINTTYNMTSDTDNQKEFVSSDGTQLIIAVTTRQQDNGINGTPETGWEVRFVKSGYNTLISKYLYSNWQNIFTSDFELIHDRVSGGTIYSGIILHYSEEGSSSGSGANTDVIIISGAGSSQVNGTYTKTEESGTAGQTDYRRVYKTADGNGIISIGVVDGSISPAINATLTYTGVPYYQSATVNTVAEIASTTWNTIAAGQTPVPTVTFGS